MLEEIKITSSLGVDFPMAKVAPIVAKNLDKHPEFSKEDHE